MFEATVAGIVKMTFINAIYQVKFLIFIRGIWEKDENTYD